MHFATIARVGTAGIQPPVPRREDRDVAGPEDDGRQEQLRWREFVRDQSGDQQCERPDHIQRDDARDDKAQPSIELVAPHAAREHSGNDQQRDYHQRNP